MARIELSNIGGGGGTTLSLTTTGTSGAATLAGSVLNIPIYQGQLTLTTTGTSGAATLSGDILNIPQYSGGGTPAGSAGQVQFNSTPSGSFAASANLAWDDTAVQLNINTPLSPTGKLNVKGSGTLTTVNTRLTDSGNIELFKVLDNGNTNIGTGFNWDNTNGRLGIGVSSPTQALEVNGSALIKTGATSGTFIGGGSTTRYTTNSGINTSAIYLSAASAGNDVFVLYVGGSATSNINQYWNSNGDIRTRGSGYFGAATGAEVIGALSARLTVKGSNTSGGTNALLVQNSTPSDIYKIENDGKISYWATNTAAGTTGAQTINRPSGTVNFGIGATSLVVTNSLCTTASLVFAEVRTNDATATIKNVVPAAGSFTINLGAAATAETSVGFFIIN